MALQNALQNSRFVAGGGHHSAPAFGRTAHSMALPRYWWSRCFHGRIECIHVDVNNFPMLFRGFHGFAKIDFVWIWCILSNNDIAESFVLLPEH